MNTAQQLSRCAQILAGVCDGAVTQDGHGYNKLDGQFGRDVLAVKPAAEWSPRLTWVAYTLLRKYRGQLSAYGVDWDAIPVPPEVEKRAQAPAPTPRGIVAPRPAQAAPRGTGSLALDGKVVRISFAYDPDLVAAVKELPGRRFDAARKQWTVPSTSAEATIAAVHFGAEHGLHVPTDLVALAATLVVERDLALAKSRAAASAYTVDGLGGELQPFQRAGVEYAHAAERCMIADEMGLGKTVQALAWLQAGGLFPAIIVVPASLKLNWVREAQKWLPGVDAHVLSGSPPKGGTSLIGGGRTVWVINYDILGRWAKVLAAAKPTAVIFDESHYLKNRGTKKKRTQRTEAAANLAKEIKHILMLTGTPVLSRPSELISQLSILRRLEDLGGFWGFAKRFCAAYEGAFGWDLSGASNLGELNAKLRATCFIRREKADVLKELPAKRRATIYLPLDNRAEYDREERAFARAAARGQMDPAAHLTHIEDMKQLCVAGKLAGVKEWITDFLQSGQKLVVFAHHRETVEALAREFGAPSITGDTPMRDRQAAVDRFQTDADCRVIVLNLQAGGVGLTLTAASNVAFVELGWTPGAHDQAEDRCHRIGQTDSVTAWYLLADRTIDTQIYDLIDGKRGVVTTSTSGVLAAVVDGLVNKHRAV